MFEAPGSNPADASDGSRITFESGGETIVGRLYQAEFSAGPAPAVAIIGPMTFVKEQAPLQYARSTRLGIRTRFGSSPH